MPEIKEVTLDYGFGDIIITKRTNGGGPTYRFTAPGFFTATYTDLLVLNAIVAGFTTKEIARKLPSKFQTIKNRRVQLGKDNAKFYGSKYSATMPEMAVRAESLGLLDIKVCQDIIRLAE